MADQTGMPDENNKNQQEVSEKDSAGRGKVKTALSLALLIAGFIAVFFGIKDRLKSEVPENPSPSIEQPSLSIQHTVVRIRDEKVDSGTIHVFVKNEGSRPARIVDVKIDDYSAMDYREGTGKAVGDVVVPIRQLDNPLIVWSTVFPPEIQPGRVADVMLRLRHKLRCKRTITIMPKEGTPLQVAVRPEGPLEAFRIDDIAFSESLDTAYVYVTNTGTSSITEPRFSFDAARKATCQYAWRGLTPGQKGLAVVKFDKSLPRGMCVNLRIETAEKLTAQASLRVFSLFPISSWPHGGYGGDTRKDFYFDATMFCTPFSGKGGDPDEQMPPPLSAESPQRACYVYRDTNCRDFETENPLGTNANVCWKRAWSLYETDPQRACFLHCCLHRKIRSYSIYGEVLDFVGYTPLEVAHYPIKLKRRYSGNPLRNAYYARSAKRYAAPRPIILNQFCRSLLPEELWISVFSQIGEGANGILYSTSQHIKQSSRDALALQLMNRILQTLKPYLRIGDPLSMVRDNEKHVRFYPILGGNRGLVVIAINEHFANRFPSISKNWLEHSGESWPKDDGTGKDGNALPAESAGLVVDGPVLDGGAAAGLYGTKREFRAYPVGKLKVQLPAPSSLTLTAGLELTNRLSAVPFSIIENENNENTLSFSIPLLKTVNVYLFGPDEMLEIDQDADGVPDLVEFLLPQRHPSTSESLEARTDLLQKTKYEILKSIHKSRNGEDASHSDINQSKQKVDMF